MAASDEKDRLGQTLADIGKVRESLWAADRDRELLAKLRQAVQDREAAAQQGPQQPAKTFSRLLCPIDFEEGSLKALKLASA